MPHPPTSSAKAIKRPGNRVFILNQDADYRGDISGIERGSIFPNEKTLLRLADALGAEWRMVDKAMA